MRQVADKAFHGLYVIVKSDFAQNLARDIKSLRVILNWIMIALYVWMCICATLFHPEAITTAITVTGGVVSVIFTGYVLTKTYEKTRQTHTPPTPPADTPEEESDA